MGNARILGMQEDLKLVGYRFNIALTAFFVTYVLFEIPANILCKKFGPRYWLSFLTFGFGLITMCIAFTQSFQTLIVTRVLLGVFEAGILPGIIFTFSKFYRRYEITFRVGVMASFASLSGSFGGLLATGLSKIPSSSHLDSWRYIFLFEGIITMVVGALVLALMPNDPSSASFLTTEERIIGADRIAAEAMTKGYEHMTLRVFKRALINLNTQLIALGICCSLLAMNSVALFMPTLLRGMGYSSIRSQLLTVPPYAIGTIVCIIAAYISDRFRTRGPVLLVIAPCIVVGFVLLSAVQTVGVKYFAICLATLGAFTSSPILLAWSVDNAAGPAVRAIVSAYCVGLGSVGAIVSTWTYLPKDAPRYLQGHLVNLGFGCMLFALVTILTFYLRWENRQRANGRRDWRLENASEEEVNQLGHSHPAFRYTP
ncbi:hypothetical protein H2201_003940 [Coniosporium apollinis]|uniref:Major facilitator superfamily (MFS) profile domain-containing protein n=1 Tax=Coniosporium apollinis TaxID=61459 RepID=A0ABQ9NVR0_9PEZI|nr:hypothetical protein H2201_003940 [Coniosporium apollinis]